MNALRTTVLALGLLVLPIVVFADPVPGVYNSTDLGGSLLTGRSSTSRTGPNSGLPHLFNTQSWDGATLGTQWWAKCGIETTPFGVQDNRDGNGTGTVVYTSTFSGGDFWFGPGPWGSGQGTFNGTTVISTVQFVNNVAVASRANVNSSGEFDNGCGLTFVITNGIGVGETPFLVKPASYPDFLDENCDPTRLYGTWGDVIQITLMIDCATQAENSTWGRVKTLYR